ncbi:BPSL0761 family protein [Pseudomonas sp. A-R-26]|uniref:BPSL0761 family protein n=1 Tax=Pseudomonas sp. A-R-26 TaxID=2832404 RepID=UPI002958603D|nr:BPSL0761 family protein [Pseudomonas sp. A-R-26]
MTMPFERTRSVAEAHDFLTELNRDTEVPERIKQRTIFSYATFPPNATFPRLAGFRSKRKA